MGIRSSKKHKPLVIPTIDSKIALGQNYKYLVFSGGGIKGVSYCGALDILNKLHILGPNIKGYAGTSAGSIIAGLLAVGYSSEELNKIMIDMDMDKIFDDKIGVIRDTINLVKTYGVAPGNYIYDLLGELIKAKTGSADYTISQLYLDHKIKLVVVGTDMNISRARYFSPDALYEADQTIPIRKAIRISMSIPFMFEPVLHQGHLHVDGGVLDNFPLSVFDQNEPNPKVLGLRILTEFHENKLTNPDTCPEKLDSILDYSLSFIKTFMIENDRKTITDAYNSRTIAIITPDYSITQFSISTEDKNILIEAGVKYAVEFFDKK